MQNIENLKVDELNLWTENPRDPIDVESDDYEIISRAILDNKKKWNLNKLINQMGTYYDLSELPTVVKMNGNFVVYDGNRRIAILKYLQNKELYAKLGGGLLFPSNFGKLKEIPCNVCDIETALNNVERKHTLSGTWGELERDYFLHVHRGKEKSRFVWLEEQTGLISNTKKMGKRFVKEEVLTDSNLEKIGFSFNTDTGFVSNYDKEVSENILFKVTDLVENNIISTRNNRKKLKGPLLENYPDLKDIIEKYDPNKNKTVLSKSSNKSSTYTRKTPTTIQNKTLFGKTLQLKSGKVNDMYRAIISIYEKNINNENVLPIVGMSLRLILEIGARVYYEINDRENAQDDKLYTKFLKVARGEMVSSKKTTNFFSLTDGWLNKEKNIAGILSKYAHGNILTNRTDILLNSQVIGDILEFYFGK